MVESNRSINITYVQDKPFRVNAHMTFHIDLFDKRDIVIDNLNKQKYSFFCKQDLLKLCKTNHPEDTLEITILKNYPMMKTYIRKLLNEIVEPYVCNKTLGDHDTIVITGLDTLDDQVINVIDIISNHTNDMYHKYDIKLRYEIILHEQERFIADGK